MAIPTLVNGQITDAVTQSNLSVLGVAPAMAMGSMYQSVAHSTGLMFQNTVQAQQQTAIAAQAAANMGVMQIYSLNTMAGAVATGRIAQSDTATSMLTLLVVLAALKKL